jgi:hypothetical protein
MKIEIYEEPKQPVVKPEEPLRLRLVRWCGGVLLRAVHADGSVLGSGAIIMIDLDGTVHRCKSVSKDLGLPLDSMGRVVLVGD